MSNPIYVIGYARVSTPKQAQTGESLDTQEKKIREYCEKKCFTLLDDKVFREPYSGSNLFRPAYKEILSIIKRNYKTSKQIKYLVFWDFDRLTRGGSADYDQIWKDVDVYNVELKDTTEIIQEKYDLMDEFGFDYTYDWASGRKSEEAERTKAEDSRKMKKKILQTLILPEIRLTIDGYHIGKPDYGFKNKNIKVGNKDKVIQVRKIGEAEFIETVYRLRIKGTKTDQEICDEVNAMGYKSREMNKWDKKKENIIGKIGGKKLEVKQLQKYLKRYTYCGIICEKWTKYQPIKAKYEGLVSVDDWNKANRGKVFLERNGDDFTLLKNINIHSNKRHKYNPKFPFKGVLMCEVCKSMGRDKEMKASATKGKSGNYFPAYHCERGHKRNSQPQKKLEDAYQKYLGSIRFTDKFLKIFEKTIYLQFRKREGELAEYTSKANMNVGELEIKKKSLIDAFSVATSDIVRKSIEEEIIKIQKQIDEARSQRDKMELKEADITNFIGWCKNIMEHPAKILTDIGSEQELKQTFSLFFEEFPTYTELVSGTPKLSLIFRLSEEFKVNKDLLVTLRGIEPRLQE